MLLMSHVCIAERVPAEPVVYVAVEPVPAAESSRSAAASDVPLKWAEDTHKNWELKETFTEISRNASSDVCRQ